MGRSLIFFPARVPRCAAQPMWAGGPSRSSDEHYRGAGQQRRMGRAREGLLPSLPSTRHLYSRLV